MEGQQFLLPNWFRIFGMTPDSSIDYMEIKREQYIKSNNNYFQASLKNEAKNLELVKDEMSKL